MAALAFTTGAAAQATTDEPAPATGRASRTTVYQGSFFTQYAPRTALDIVQRVPGFSLDLGATQTQQGSVDVRGFSGTAGNVVINGSRPSTKARHIPRPSLDTVGWICVSVRFCRMEPQSHRQRSTVRRSSPSW